MSRSFRESYLGFCVKPLRSWLKGSYFKAARSLRRRLNMCRHEEERPLMPKTLNRKWMGDYSWGVWTFSSGEHRLVRRNGRKFLIRDRNFVETEDYSCRPYKIFRK